MQRHVRISRRPALAIAATALGFLAAWIAYADYACAQKGGVGPAPRPQVTAPKDATKPPSLVDEDPPIITRVYNMTDLIAPKPPYHFQGIQLPAVKTDTDGSGGGAGPGMGMGGMGMGGMGMMGGTGTEPTAGPAGQKHGQPASQGQSKGRRQPRGPVSMSGWGGGPEMALPWRAPMIDWDSVIELITSLVEPASWDAVGGPGSIAPLGRVLVVSQTAEVHKKIEALFQELRKEMDGQRTVTIRATWLLLDLKQLNQITKAQAKDGGLDRAVLDEISVKAKGYHGQITCFDGQTVHLISGRSRSLILSAIPVVGSEPGYQPVVVSPEIGVLLQVTPHLLTLAQGALVDVQSLVTRADQPATPIPFLTTSAGGAKPDAEGKTPSTNVLSLDRLNVVAQQLLTTVRVPLGKPLLVGGLTLDSSPGDQDAANAPQLYLFIELTAREGLTGK